MLFRSPTIVAEVDWDGATDGDHRPGDGSPEETGPESAGVDAAEDAGAPAPQGWGRIGGDGLAGDPANHE